MEHRAVRHDEELIHSSSALRRAVGFTGMALPFALLLVHGHGPDSVSAGYYTAGSALLVAGAAALLVGQIPRSSNKAVTGAFAWGWGAGFAAAVWPAVQLLAAAILFVLRAPLCLWLFPMSDEPAHANRKKDQRTLVHCACGAVILICLGMLFVRFAHDGWLGAGGVFWRRTAILLAFGLSWTVKGKGNKFLDDGGASKPAPALAFNRRPL